MGIINTNEILKDAYEKHYAVGGFICYDMEMLQGVARAAKSEQSHVLLQASCRVDDYAGAKFIRKMAEAASELYKMDYAVHLDHGDSVERCLHCIDEGFTSVMLDNTGLEFEENVRLTKQVVEYAHSRGVSVEGEVMHPVEGPLLYMTSAEEAAEYVGRTGVDSLSICVGNPHGLANDYERHLDLELIEKIRNAVPGTPLVLHALGIASSQTIEEFDSVGGCCKNRHGFPIEEIQQAIKLGVAKINSGFDIKMLITTAIRKYMIANPTVSDPRQYLGRAREAVENAVKEDISEIFGGSGTYFDTKK